MGPDIIMLIRHGEKPTPAPGSDRGVRLDGTPSPGSLTPRGWARAGALARLFAPQAGAPLAPGLHRPASLFASNVSGPGGGSEREAESLVLLAEALGVRLNLDHGVGEEQQLLAALSHAASPALVCWQHGHLPDIAAGLSPSPAAPAEWPRDRFDVVWVFQREPADGGYRFTQVPERLLSGDQDAPIS